MTKKRANKLFDSNIFWAVVSLLAALCIWVYMTDTQEEPISVTLSGVEVVFEGEDVLQSQRGLVITDVSAETVDVTISGTRINIGRLSSEDVKAVIDVSRASSTSNYNMGYTLRFPSGVDSDAVRLERSSPSTISFQVTRMDERQFPVVAAFKGSVADGYVLGDIEYEPATISVRGPQSVLDSIEDVYAEVTLQDVNSTRTVESGFILRDADGSEISKEGLEFDFDTISVTIPISQMKTVPIYVTYIEGSGATRENTSATLDVKEITIAGDAASVDGINRIEVGPIDLTDFELTAGIRPAHRPAQRRRERLRHRDGTRRGRDKRPRGAQLHRHEHRLHRPSRAVYSRARYALAHRPHPRHAREPRQAQRPDDEHPRRRGPQRHHRHRHDGDAERGHPRGRCAEHRRGRDVPPHLQYKRLTEA